MSFILAYGCTVNEKVSEGTSGVPADLKSLKRHLKTPLLETKSREAQGPVQAKHLLHLL